MTALRWQSGMKKLLSSLFLRILLVTIIALISFLLVFFTAFRSALMFPGSIEDVAVPLSRIVESMEAAPLDEENAVLDLFESPTRIAVMRDAFPDDASPNEAYRQRLIKVGPDISDVLADRPVQFRFMAPASAKHDLSLSERQRFPFISVLEVTVALDDGRVLAVLFSPAAVIVDRPGLVGGLLAIAACFIGVSAAVGIRLLLRPLKVLEGAADRFGATFDPEPVKEQGPEEIRRVARALNRTQDQVRGLINERARMVSALSHDIFTGLTRLRLRVEGLGGDEKSALSDDIDQMEVLVEDMLTYAKSGQPQLSVELIALGRFALAYAQDAPTAVPFHFAGNDTEFTIAGDPKALTRVLNNLVDNAVKYGGGASISCENTPTAFLIHVDDDGPGIPSDELTKVVEPFYRLESSRSRLTGGSGMGLGIAKGLIEAQGAALTLSNRQQGGLRATLSFPRMIEVCS